MMIEGDVILRGQGTYRQQMLPVMAHPPQSDGLMTFTEWLRTVLGTGKGIKIDFKSIESVELCLQELNQIDPPVSNN